MVEILLHRLVQRLRLLRLLDPQAILQKIAEVDAEIEAEVEDDEDEDDE